VIMSVSNEIRDIVYSLRNAGMEEEAESLMLLASSDPTVVEMGSALEAVRSILLDMGINRGLSVYKHDSSHLTVAGTNPFNARKVVRAVVTSFNSLLPVKERKLKFAPEIKADPGALTFRLY